MLLPALNKARQAAYATTCKNQLKQQGTGLTLYGGDHRDYFPFTEGRNYMEGIRAYINAPAEVHTGQKTIFSCPADLYPHNGPTCSYAANAGYSWSWGDKFYYGMEWRSAADSGSRRYGEIQKPSETYAVMEIWIFQNRLYNSGGAAAFVTSMSLAHQFDAPGQPIRNNAYHGNRRQNMLFADMHVADLPNLGTDQKPNRSASDPYWFYIRKP